MWNWVDAWPVRPRPDRLWFFVVAGKKVAIVSLIRSRGPATFARALARGSMSPSMRSVPPYRGYVPGSFHVGRSALMHTYLMHNRRQACC